MDRLAAMKAVEGVFGKAIKDKKIVFVKDINEGQDNHYLAVGLFRGHELGVSETYLSLVPDGINGYLIVENTNIPDEGYDGIFGHINVHGGITFARIINGYCIYGFDTAHYNSREYPINDADWILGQIDCMARGIFKVKELYNRYMKSEEYSKEKADLYSQVNEASLDYNEIEE